MVQQSTNLSEINTNQVRKNSLKEKILRDRKNKQEKRLKRAKNKPQYQEITIGEMINHMNSNGMFNVNGDIPNIVNLANDTMPKNFLGEGNKPNILDLYKNRSVASWDDVDQIYNTCLNCILELGEKVSFFANGVNQMGKNYFDNFDIFDKSLVILAKDMEILSNKIFEIKEPIKHKKGIITQESELMQCFDAYQSFLMLVTEINTILMPTVCNLSSEYDTAYARYLEDTKVNSNQQATEGA